MKQIDFKRGAHSGSSNPTFESQDPAASQPMNLETTETVESDYESFELSETIKLPDLSKNAKLIKKDIQNPPPKLQPVIKSAFRYRWGRPQHQLVLNHQKVVNVKFGAVPRTDESNFTKQKNKFYEALYGEVKIKFTGAVTDQNKYNSLASQIRDQKHEETKPEFIELDTEQARPEEKPSDLDELIFDEEIYRIEDDIPMEEEYSDQEDTRYEYFEDRFLSEDQEKKESEKSIKEKIYEELNEKAKQLFKNCYTRGPTSHSIRILHIFHTPGSITFEVPNYFHLRIKKMGNGCFIAHDGDQTIQLMPGIEFMECVGEFLEMLFLGNDVFTKLIVEVEDEQFLELLVEILKTREEFLEVQHLFANKLTMNSIGRFINPRFCQTIAILKNGAQEFDKEFLGSPIWRNLRRFISFEECRSLEMLDRYLHVREYYVMLKDGLTVGEVLDLKEKFLQNPQVAHALIFSKPGIQLDLINSVHRALGEPVPIDFQPKTLPFDDNGRRLFLTLDQYCVEFRREGFKKNEQEEKMIRKEFEAIIDWKEGKIVEKVMDSYRC
ncbi:hypothetical protein CAEBREN_20428 [Caenorhabditis brenneri]|uniref:DUF38 domain-containing protein n=1 Tax=Caenorhabditis brenneri TaxID=135651 RepID=G0P1Q2_CAEBE|nr:hypothetical protein CAEBREN_20428 [Caenorhabditis brenneri]